MLGNDSGGVDAIHDGLHGAVDGPWDVIGLEVTVERRATDNKERADFDFVVLATYPQYAEVLAGLDDDQITEANDRLATFFREECGAG